MAYNGGLEGLTMNTYSPFVNTDVEMSQEMLEALTLHETFCIMSKINAVTVDHVKSFLIDRYGVDFADQFQPEFLFSSPKI